MLGDSNLHDIRACVFDAYGTLFDFNAPLAARRARIGPAADRLAALWRQKQIDYTWLRSLMGKYADFWHVTGEALDYAMAACEGGGPGAPGRADAALSRARRIPGRPALPGSAEGPADAHGGALQRLAHHADGRGQRQHADASAGPVLSVDSCGVFKPHPSVYQLAVDELDAQPAQVCFVSANGWDAAGAAAFGFRAVWIDRAGAPAETLPFRPAAQIRGLGELAGLLPS